MIKIKKKEKKPDGIFRYLIRAMLTIVIIVCVYLLLLAKRDGDDLLRQYEVQAHSDISFDDIFESHQLDESTWIWVDKKEKTCYLVVERSNISGRINTEVIQMYDCYGRPKKWVGYN